MGKSDKAKQGKGTPIYERLTPAEIDAMDRHLNAELWEQYQKGRFDPNSCDPPYYPVPPEEWGIVQTDHLDPEDNGRSDEGRRMSADAI